MSEPKRTRCAIYTRKSTEEGLEQAFNTLDAQREACEAYVLSQAGEGWTALPQLYEDGGFSGGNLDRPAIQRLLADVDAGRVDVIVVYKVDRLTRSLMDFSRIVERLDARGVSFVSVTQAFNTTTSMGRLTLNVLLSFAQFEREVTSERIRDKIAASKAKGMWMGGAVPLGYDLQDQKLVVNAAEAAQVRHLFMRYAELGSGVGLVRELRRDGIETKRRTSRSGRTRGGVQFSCGALYYILQNRIYVGEIVHRGVRHAGEHPGIVESELFDSVQNVLARNRRRRAAKRGRTTECMLAGLVHQGADTPMTTSFSYGRGGRLYRYYVAGSLDPARQAASTKPLRVPAGPLETLVLRSLSRVVGHSIRWIDARSLLHRVELWNRSIQLVFDHSRVLEPQEDLNAWIKNVQHRLLAERVKLDELGVARIIIDQPAVFRGGAVSWVRGSNELQANQQMRTRLCSAHQLLELHRLSPTDGDLHTLATAPSEQRQRRLVALGLMAPILQRSVLAGEVPSARAPLLERLPLAWSDQIALLKADVSFAGVRTALMTKSRF